MELTIVNREIAIQLKELGFDWKVQYQYSELNNRTKPKQQKKNT